MNYSITSVSMNNECRMPPCTRFSARCGGLRKLKECHPAQNLIENLAWKWTKWHSIFCHVLSTGQRWDRSSLFATSMGIPHIQIFGKIYYKLDARVWAKKKESDLIETQFIVFLVQTLTNGRLFDSRGLHSKGAHQQWNKFFYIFFSKKMMLKLWQMSPIE